MITLKRSRPTYRVAWLDLCLDLPPPSNESRESTAFGTTGSPGAKGGEIVEVGMGDWSSMEGVVLEKGNGILSVLALAGSDSAVVLSAFLISSRTVAVVSSIVVLGVWPVQR